MSKDDTIEQLENEKRELINEIEWYEKELSRVVDELAAAKHEIEILEPLNDTNVYWEEQYDNLKKAVENYLRDLGYPRKPVWLADQNLMKLFENID